MKAWAIVGADSSYSRLSMATSREDAEAADEILAAIDVPRATLRSTGLRLRARFGERGLAVLAFGLTGLVGFWAVLLVGRARRRRWARSRTSSAPL